MRWGTVPWVSVDHIIVRTSQQCHVIGDTNGDEDGIAEVIPPPSMQGNMAAQELRASLHCCEPSSMDAFGPIAGRDSSLGVPD